MTINAACKIKKAMMIVGLAAGLSSCSLFSPVNLTNQNTYLLNTLPLHVTQKRTRSIILLVMPPSSRPVYNTTQMAYSTKPHQIAYFSQNQWAETPAQMWSPLLVQTLQHTHYFRLVTTPPYAAHYDYILNTQILQLEQNFTCQPAMLEFAVNVQIIKTSTNRVVAAKQFYIQEPMLQKTPYYGVLAANLAAAGLLKQIAGFCVSHIR